MGQTVNKRFVWVCEAAGIELVILWTRSPCVARFWLRAICGRRHPQLWRISLAPAHLWYQVVPLEYVWCSLLQRHTRSQSFVEPKLLPAERTCCCCCSAQVRLKIADDNDLNTAKEALITMSGFFVSISEEAAKRGGDATAFGVLQVCGWS